MSGFADSAPFMAKQFGSILRGYGPPVQQAGVVGDLYIDVTTWKLYNKRLINGVHAWGHHLWVVPPLYREGLKWFGASRPTNDIGVVTDYYLQWSGFANYGMWPSIWGPKTWYGWPENGDGPGQKIAMGTADRVVWLGLLDEGPFLTDLERRQLIATGLLDEIIIPVPVTADEGELVLELGLQGGGVLIQIDMNKYWSFEDRLNTGTGMGGGAAGPASAAEVGIVDQGTQIPIELGG